MVTRALRRISPIAVAVLVMGLLLTGAIDKPATANAATGVNIVDFAFTPSMVSVPIGTVVTWTNTGNAPHTVTSNTGVFESGTLNKNGTYSYTFNQAGTFRYHCKIHPDMTGTVQVGTTTTPPNNNYPTYNNNYPNYVPGQSYNAFSGYDSGQGSTCITAGYKFDTDSRTYYSYPHACNNFIPFFSNYNCRCAYPNQYFNNNYQTHPYNYWMGQVGYGGY
jgi:plastocyanin